MSQQRYDLSEEGSPTRDVLEAGNTGRVLVVDHRAAERMFTAEALVQAGYAIEEAANAAETLGKVRASAGRYDFVLIGEGLPGKDGAALATELRAMHKDLPLLLTGREDETRLRELFAEDRCVGVIGKPYSASKLQAALTSLGIYCKARP